MKERISGIVLGTVRHSDRHNVTSIYTKERGRMSFLTPAGASKKSRQTQTRLLPLSIIEAQINVATTRDLYILPTVESLKTWRTVYYNPMKSTIVLFISEFLNRLLRDATSEPNLWNFIVDSIDYFDSTDNSTSIANFHIAFLIGMAHLTGIRPDIEEYHPGMEFDMKAGQMVYPFSIQSLNGIRIDTLRSAFLPKLIRMNYANSKFFRFNGKERSEVLNEILKYFGCHFPGSDHLKSLDILKEIFT